MAGKPVAVVTRLTKRPGLYGARWVLRRWLDEVQTCAWFGMILDCDDEILSVPVSPIESHDKFFITDAICQLFAILQTDSLYVQLYCVKRDGFEVIVESGKSGVDGAADGFLFKVKCDVKLDMLYVCWPVRGILYMVIR